MTESSVGESTGGRLGQTAGAAAGSAAGSAVPGVGTAIGGMVGSKVGKEVGEQAGKVGEKEVRERASNVLGDSPPYSDFKKQLKGISCDESKHLKTTIERKLKKIEDEYTEAIEKIENDNITGAVINAYIIGMHTGGINDAMLAIYDKCDISLTEWDEADDEFAGKTARGIIDIGNEIEDYCETQIR